MDPFSGATAGSLFAPPPRPYHPARTASASLLAAHLASRQDSRSPMPARPDATDDPFFTSTSLATSHPAMPHLSHPATAAPIPHTSVPFAPTELAVLQRWSQVYHSHRARCPVGPPPGMPAAVYDIFERLGGATQFAAPAGEYAAQQQVIAPAITEEPEAFRPEAWSSGMAGMDGHPTPGLYRSSDGEASAPSSSSPTQTLRSSGSGGTRPHTYSGVGGVRIGNSPSYGALDQHMRALELKRGMKRNASGLGRNKTNRVVSAPVRGSAGDKKASSPSIGMKGSSPLMTRHSSPLVGLGSSADGYDPQSLFAASTGGDVAYQGQSQAALNGHSAFAFSGSLGCSKATLTEAPSFLDGQAQDGEEEAFPGSQSTQTTLDENEKATPAPTLAPSTAAPKEKGKSRTSASVPDRTDPNTMPDRNDPNVTIIDDPAALRGMRYEDFEPHMFIGRSALGTEYPRNLEPGAGHERIRCLLCKCGYAGPNGRSMWRRHVSQKHVILLAGKRGTVAKKKDGNTAVAQRMWFYFYPDVDWALMWVRLGAADEAAVMNSYIEKRERTLASKKRYASKKRMDQKLDRLAAQGFDVGKMVADEAKQLIRELGGAVEGEGEEAEGDENEDSGMDEPMAVASKNRSRAGPLQDVPPNSSEGNKPKLRLKPLSAPEETTGPENVLPPSSPLSPVPTTSVSVSPSEPVHPGPTFSFDPPAPANPFLFSPFDDEVRRGYGVVGSLGKAFGEDGEGGVKRVRAFKSTARLDDDVFPLLGAGLSSPLRIGRSRSVGAVESPTRGGGGDAGEGGSEPETPRTNAAKVAARRLQMFALESPIANLTPARTYPRGTLSRSMTTPVLSMSLGSHTALMMAQTPLADGEEELARALGLAPDIGHGLSEDSPVRKRKRGPNTPFPIFPSSKLRESETMLDEYWPSSPFTINTPAPASKRARKSSEGVMDSYLAEITVGAGGEWSVFGFGEVWG
ncbi:hypothetical protein FRC06_010156 [Ceratobasidium sp. 370]|nr:hypothetical protein FRC06_010156 [Ceratobasidium sp. 370]